MKKTTKLIALLLAALMLMTSVAFAATGSKEEPSKKKETGRYTEYITYSDNTATLIGTKKSTYKHKTKKVLKTTTIKGKKYTITKIGKNAFAKMKKLKVVKVYATKALKVQKGAFGKLNTICSVNDAVKGAAVRSEHSIIIGKSVWLRNI